MLSVVSYRYRESAIVFIASLPLLRFDDSQFAPQLNSAVYGVRHQRLGRCENAALTFSLFLPSSYRSVSSVLFVLFVLSALSVLSSDATFSVLLVPLDSASHSIIASNLFSHVCTY